MKRTHSCAFVIFGLVSAFLSSCGSSDSPLPSSARAVSGMFLTTEQSAPTFVRRSESNLAHGDRTFYFAGTNQYYLFYKPNRMVDDVLTRAQALGLNTLRTWAFCEGPLHDGYCFQPEAGVYHEPTFQKMDYIISQAAKYNIKLVMTLSNNWGGSDHFGGIDQYLAWVGGSLKHDDFYTNEQTKKLFKNYVQYLLERINSITGVKYKDDPTILAWELMNEPRADNKPVLYAWIDEMAGFIKSIDHNHLVGTGSEGGFSSDFYETHKSPNIDMASLHLYPDWWNLSPEAAENYIKEHMRIAREQLKKPVYLGEFGLRDKSKRDDVYHKWYDIMDQGNMNGAMFWLLSGIQYGDPKNEGTLYPDYDGFTVYCPDDKGTCAVISDYSKKVQQKLVNPQITLLSPDVSKPVNKELIIEAKASSVATLSTLNYRLDQGAWSSLSNLAGVYRTTLDSTTLTDGNHLLELRAIDSASHETSQQYTIYINNQPGQATLVVGPQRDGCSPNLGEIYVADDADSIYFLVHRYDNPTKPFSVSNYIFIDIDNNSATGENGFDHRLDLKAASDSPQGYGDTFEWYPWNGTYWAYGHYWQASDANPPIKGNRTPETLPTGTVAAAPNGMMELSFPKNPPSGQKAGGTGVKFWIQGACGAIGSSTQPFFHPYSNSQKITIDGRITSFDEWKYKRQ